jgi:hypothetical protein
MKMLLFIIVLFGCEKEKFSIEKKPIKIETKKSNTIKEDSIIRCGNGVKHKPG